MSKKRTREPLNIEITPLIDVVFLLLIFFMVSTVFKKDELALLLNLPKVEKGDGQSKPEQSFYIELGTEDIAVNGKKYSIEQMDEVLGAIKEKTKPVELRVDKEVKYDRLISILDKLKKFQLNNLSLITEQ